MISVDTNVIVRYVTRDDNEQEIRARRLFETEQVHVSLSVLLETEWVLRSTYKLSRAIIDRTFTVLLESESVEVEHVERALEAMKGFRAGLDFADALHLAGCPTRRFATFDTDLVKRAGIAFESPQVINP